MTQCEVRQAMSEDMPMSEEWVHRSGDSFVLSIDGIDIGVGGFENAGMEHLYQAWMIPFEDLRGHEIKVVRAVRRQIALVFASNPKLLRIQAQVHELDSVSCRFALACGFTPESMMEGAAPDGYATVMFRKLKGH